MPVRFPLPVISVGALAVLMGLALGIGLGSAPDHPQGESGDTGPTRGGEPEPRQSGGDLPPMDFEGRVQSTSPRPSKASTTTAPSASAETSVAQSSEPRRTEEVPSAVGVTPTPALPTLPSVPEVSASSLVEMPSTSVSAGT
ncbi:hypothetical protein ACFFQW_21420 [Umezawaea endophytica]|uniref:Uncharacterized protein n=1 Tax=Umezawaea endophytica TaxID=1654476 RepID=A0A9X2VLR4_9PSEU|nr:hypothetical protein [Umezawaea endophytica]MCS7478826.1 hypothetical protein [Umezawaea endophytica]